MEIQEQHSEEPSVRQSYEPPALTAVGEFSEDTLGFGNDHSDFLGKQGW
ncbi:lasso RiPP family leader peptide-containing protein [Streptomyces sp. SAS_270]